MEKLKKIIEDNSTGWGKIFDYFIQSLIITSLVTFCISTLPDLSNKAKEELDTIETIVVIIFSIEYIIRLAVSNKPLKYIFSFYGLIDLIAIVPFYLSSGIDLRAIRVFRFLRIFRALKIVRYSKAIVRYRVAISLAKEELVLFFLATILLLFFSSVGIYYFENPVQPEAFKSIFHSMWWSVATLTTVGYGDIYPITVGGKLFTFFILMIGLGIVAVPTGLLASALSKARDLENERDH